MSDSRSELMRFLDGGVSPVHTVAMAEEFLTERGFSALPLAEPFSVRRGGRYYIESGSFLAAVTVGSRDTLRIAAAHTDWPCMRIKPDPELVAGGCCRLSVEPYGGAILNSWLDRPLGLAGTVLLRTDDPMRPEQRLIRWDAPLLVIPNLAIHMNREVNKGVPYRANVDMLPICRTMREACEKDGYLVREIAAKLDVRPLDILSFELSAYCYAPSALVGFQQDLLCSPRLDNLTSVHACLRGLVDATGDTINIAVLYDSEEIGSNTRRGADSSTLTFLLEKLASGLGMARETLLDACFRGMLLSCDAAHAQHPNHPEFADATSAPVLGGGVALKRSPRYASDAETCAVIRGLCDANDIPLQTYMNRADLPGGSTVGSMVSALLAMPAADVGVPILAMHAACETMGAADQDSFVRLCTAFFSAK